MKDIIIGSTSIVFGFLFLLYLLKKSKLYKDRDPMGRIAKIKGYTGSFLFIVGGIIIIIREIFK